MTTLAHALRVSSAQTAIAVQRKILAAGNAIDPEWKRLGWEAVDNALDALIEALPREPSSARLRL